MVMMLLVKSLTHETFALGNDLRAKIVTAPLNSQVCIRVCHDTVGIGGDFKIFKIYLIKLQNYSVVIIITCIISAYSV